MKKLILSCLMASFAVFAGAQVIVSDFDNTHLGDAAVYTLGDLDGQPAFDPNAWSAPAQATVVADPTAGTTNFSGQVLSLTGSPTAKMNNFASMPLGGTPAFLSFDAWMTPGTAADPSELFLRFNVWGSFLSIKLDEEMIEVRRTPSENIQLTGVTIPSDEVFNFAMQYTVAGGIGTDVEFFINGSSIGSLTGLEMPMADGDNLEIRSQNTQSYVDTIIIPEPSTYALLFGALALAFVVYRRRVK